LRVPLSMLLGLQRLLP